MKDPKINCSHDEVRDVVNLTAHPKNPNTHNDEQIRLLSEIIKHQGWRNPIVISNRSGFIVAGHGRLLAAQKLGLKKVPVDIQDFKNEADELAHLIADNRIAELSEINRATLADIIGELDDGQFNLELTGFEMISVEELMTATAPEERLTDQDKVPEAPEAPNSKLGDIWNLGNHRIMCGDSTSLESVEKLMSGEKADIVFTSPPYNADVNISDGDLFGKKKSKKLYQGGYCDNLNSSDYVRFASSVLDVCFSVTNGFIFWNVNYNAKSRFEYIKQLGEKIEYLFEMICWKKTARIPFKGSLMREFEPIFVFSTNKESLGVKKVVSNLWEVNNINCQHESHKGCFPVELPERAILLLDTTKNVFDPFCGTGSTMIACEKTGRSFFGMELDPRYCDVAIKRWQDFTGEKAVNNKTGESFKS